MVNQEVKWLKDLPKLILLMGEVERLIEDSRHSVLFHSQAVETDSLHLLICTF